MTEAQAVKTNALAAAGEDATDFLSPSQVALAERMWKLQKADPETFAKAMGALEIDRTPQGIVAYAAALEEALRSLEE